MALSIRVTENDPSAVKADVLVVPVFDDMYLPSSLPELAGEMITRRLKLVDFAGGWGEMEIFSLPESGLPSLFIAVIGLGQRTQAAPVIVEGARRATGKVVIEARRHRLRHVACLLPEENVLPLASALLEGAELANYRFTDYLPRLQHEQQHRSLQKLTFITSGTAIGLRQALRATGYILEGVELARHLVNQPASAVYPKSLVQVGRRIARDNDEVSLRVFNRAQAKKAGFTAFLAVAQGSLQEPYVIHLRYRPKGKAKARIFVIGKGITFDSGGLSIKPADMMEAMKCDMAGAASVLGLFLALPRLNLPVEVHGIIATCENMPSGSAYRPGDIVRAKNGKTIEVANTDAEGRVTLADALSYAVEQSPDAIIDLATLTGACMIALGETVAGLWSNSDELQQRLLAAAHTTGEGLCALPMPVEYKPFIQSKVADVRNLPVSKLGGAITAAMFLHEFVGTTPWAHLDIAGPSYVERPCLPYFDTGGTGYGVRLLAEYLRTI